MRATTRSLSKITEEFAFILFGPYHKKNELIASTRTLIHPKEIAIATMLLKNALVLALLLAAAVETDAGHTVRGEKHNENTRERRIKKTKKKKKSPRSASSSAGGATTSAGATTANRAGGAGGTTNRTGGAGGGGKKKKKSGAGGKKSGSGGQPVVNRFGTPGGRPTLHKSGVLAILGDRPRPISTSARTANPPRALFPSAPSATRLVGAVPPTTSMFSPSTLQPPRALLLAGVASIEEAVILQ